MLIMSKANGLGCAMETTCSCIQGHAANFAALKMSDATCAAEEITELLP
jgi:hypothetical protein